MQFANIGKTQNKNRPLCANRESGRHDANHALVHVNPTMIRLLLQGGFLYVHQNQNAKAWEYIFV